MKVKEVKSDWVDEKDAVARIAVYCHKYGNTDDRVNSVDNQGKYYIDMIDRNPDWIMAGEYAEDPRVGSRRERPQFLRLLKDCESGLVDCILCRSISIFIRNEQKEIAYIRSLQKMGIHLIFEGDGLESDSDVFKLLLTVLEAFAEGKSRAYSENFAVKKRELALNGGTPFSGLYGYRSSESGLSIVPGKAKIVRLIFDYYEHGVSTDSIAKILSEKTIPTPKGHKEWNASTIQSMIDNEKYTGDYNALKIIVEDPSKNRRDTGIKSTIYHKDHHPAIISREQFERCHIISNMRKKNTLSQYPFGEYLRCPYCGHVLYMRKAQFAYQYCCEGEGACRRFVIAGVTVQKAILNAYKDVDLNAIRKIAGMRDYDVAIEAVQFLRIKKEHPAFEKIEYWWLDDLVEDISFGSHTYFASERKAHRETAPIDDRTISIRWRCGFVSTIPSGVIKDVDNPIRKAKRWDELVMSHPDRYPQLVEEILRQRSKE